MTPSNGRADLVDPAALVVAEADLLAVRAVEQHLLRLLRQVAPPLGPCRSRSVSPAPRSSACNRATDPWPRARWRRASASGPRPGTTSRGSKKSSTPRPSQAGQAPNGALKEKSRGSISGDGEAGDRAGEVLGEGDALRLLAVPVLDRRAARSRGWRCRRRGRARCAGESASRVSRPSRTTIRSTTTSMLWRYFLSSSGGASRSWNVAVHLDPLEALLQQVLEFLAVLALAVADDRRQQVGAGALRQRHGDVDHLADLLRLDRQAGCRAE